MDNRDIVEQFWVDLYTRDWAKIATYFDPTSEYTDVPTPAEDVARGSDQIVARLRLGLEPLANIGHDVRTIVAEDDTVVTEHVEHWEWPTGEKAALPFVSMQVLRDGVIVRWWDYWDLSTLMGVAPDWWVTHIMTASVEAGLRDA
jgi:limonene-1,2-epoxide hydrolase